MLISWEVICRRPIDIYPNIDQAGSMGEKENKKKPFFKLLVGEQGQH